MILKKNVDIVVVVMMVRVGQRMDAAESFLSSLDDQSLVQYIEDLSAGQKVDYNSRSGYFHDKHLKQAAQDELLRKQHGKERYPQIFQNCTIYINGYTQPGRLQLHDMIVLHGGKFLHHLSAKGNATHIVASNLPLKKKLEFANYKVVTPNWITDSIRENKLLCWQDYSIVHDLDPIQKKLSFATDRIADCNDPHFLQNYFTNSRLHHLSAWKIDLRAQFIKNYNKNIYTIPKKDDQLAIFHIDFDCFFATVAAMSANVPCDVNKDVILVCHGSKSSDIASCNYIARNYGIKNGMWVSQAKKLIPQGVKIVSLPYNFQQFELKSKLFYQTLHELQIFDLILPVSIDETVCVIINDSSSNYHESYQSLCTKIRASVYSVTGGCTVSIGCSNSLVGARLALKKGKPNNYYIMSQEDYQNDAEQFWSSFTLRDLPGVGSSIVSKLENVIKPFTDNLYDLRKRVALDVLQNCLGAKTGSKLYLALQLKDDEESSKVLFEPQTQFLQKSLSIEVNWAIRFANIQQVDTFIDRCSVYLANKLVQLDKKTSHVLLKILKRAPGAPVEPPKYMGCGECDSFSRSSRLGVPTDQVGVVATEVKHLYRSLGCQPRELRGLSIQFANLIDANGIAQTKLPFQKVISEVIYNNLPNDVKIDIKNELDKRHVGISTTKVKRIGTKEYSPNKVEADFINELPTQIRHELDHDLRIIKKAQQTKRAAMQNQINKRQQFTNDSKTHFQGQTSLFSTIKFQGETSFKKISHIVYQWICATLDGPGPHEKDVQLFEHYLLKLSSANKVHMVLQLTEMVSKILNLKANTVKSTQSGLQEWEHVLLNVMVPILNKNRHSYQTVRKIDIDFSF